MVPNAWVVLDALPQTPNGKVDRAALPLPTSDRPALANPFTPPQTETERCLARIWQDVLGLETVGIDDSFFDLGGHSVLAVRVRERIRAELGRELPLRDLFERPTPRLLAAFLDGRELETRERTVEELDDQADKRAGRRERLKAQRKGGTE
jgi:acyl carrier protein